jgi:hypothetical protein
MNDGNGYFIPGYIVGQGNNYTVYCCFLGMEAFKGEFIGSINQA